MAPRDPAIPGRLRTLGPASARLPDDERVRSLSVIEAVAGSDPVVHGRSLGSFEQRRSRLGLAMQALEQSAPARQLG
jgi:hypothetical protein